MSEFTPGPWKAKNARVYAGEVRVAKGCWGHPSATTLAQAKINAQLIAASPLLFQFAKQKAFNGDPWAAEIVKAIEAGEDTNKLWR